MLPLNLRFYTEVIFWLFVICIISEVMYNMNVYIVCVYTAFFWP